MSLLVKASPSSNNVSVLQNPEHFLDSEWPRSFWVSPKQPTINKTAYTLIYARNWAEWITCLGILNLQHKTSMNDTNNRQQVCPFQIVPTYIDEKHQNIRKHQNMCNNLLWEIKLCFSELQIAFKKFLQSYNCCIVVDATPTGASTILARKAFCFFFSHSLYLPIMLLQWHPVLSQKQISGH